MSIGATICQPLPDVEVFHVDSGKRVGNRSYEVWGAIPPDGDVYYQLQQKYLFIQQHYGWTSSHKFNSGGWCIFAVDREGIFKEPTIDGVPEFGPEVRYQDALYIFKEWVKNNGFELIGPVRG